VLDVVGSAVAPRVLAGEPGPVEQERGLAAALLGKGRHRRGDERREDLAGQAGLGEEPDGDAVLVVAEAEEDVLGADPVVAERDRPAERRLERPLRARRERDLADRDLVAAPDDLADASPRRLEVDAVVGEDAAMRALDRQEADEEVLRPDVVVGGGGAPRPARRRRPGGPAPRTARTRLERAATDARHEVVDD
jgi:hypothetical protein